MAKDDFSFEECLKRLASEIPDLRNELKAEGKERDQLNQTIKKLATKYLILALVLPPILTGGIGYFSGKKWGVAEGFDRAYTLAKDEKAAANWANSGEGLQAYLMGKSGALSMIIHCSGTDWHTEQKGKRIACYPGKEGAGWYLPQ